MTGPWIQPFMRIARLRFTIGRTMLALVGLGLLAVGMITGLQVARNRLVVENRSGETIVRLEISMRSVPVATFRNLPDGKEGSASFRVVGDNSFELSGELADGTRLGGNFGYLTTGSYGAYPRFIIRKNGQIDFIQ